MNSRATLLDAGSLGLADLDWQQLQQALAPLSVHEFTAPEQVGERIANCDIVLTNKTVLGAAHFAANPQLRLVIVLATGTNNIDLSAAAEAGVRVCNIRDYSTDSLVEHTLMLMLALARNLPAHLQQVAAGQWQRAQQFCLLEPRMQPLHGRTLGIVGLGAAGRGVATVAKALGMQVLALTSSSGACTDDIPRLPLEDLLPQVDILSLHCPLTPHTAGLINRGGLRRMKSNALLVNTARGGIVVEEDLVEALEQGWIAGAATDVLTVEPPRDGNPLLDCRHPNLIITPHNAWGSVQARQQLIDQATDIVLAYRRGDILNCVNE